MTSFVETRLSGHLERGKMRAKRIYLYIGLIMAGWDSSAYAQDVVPTAEVNSSAVLGTSYNSTKDQLGAAACIIGKEVASGTSQSSFSLDQQISEDQLTKELGFSIGGKARYGVVEGSAQADFLQRTVSNSFSISLIFKANYHFSISKLTDQGLSSIGTSVNLNDDRWIQTCGDRFVNEITRGASLYVAVRVDFSSEAAKQSFTAKFSISGPLASANGMLQTASSNENSRNKVTVSALQIGGDVSKITSMLGGGDGVQTYTECTLGKFDSCAAFVGNILKYASDTKIGFPSQLSPGVIPGPADLNYATSTYESIGIYRKLAPAVLQEGLAARSDLSDMFEHNYKIETLGKRLDDVPMSQLRKKLIDVERDSAHDNITKVLPVVTICYDHIDQCRTSVDALTLKKLNDSIVTPPTFLTYCHELSLIQDLDEDETKAEIASMRSLLADNGGGFDNPIDDTRCAAADVQIKQDSSISISQATDLWQISGYINNKDVVDQSDANTLFSANRGPIEDLSPLSLMPALEYLVLIKQDISDISPLAGSNRLISLYLDGNFITDISALASKDRLVLLSLEFNNITDISPLAKNIDLRMVKLRGNPITDISPLNNLRFLTVVDLRGLPIDSGQVKALSNAQPQAVFAYTDEKGVDQVGTADKFIESWSYTKQ